jgi:hypothetical protein
MSFITCFLIIHSRTDLTDTIPSPLLQKEPAPVENDLGRNVNPDNPYDLDMNKFRRKFPVGYDPLAPASSRPQTPS